MESAVSEARNDRFVPTADSSRIFETTGIAYRATSASGPDPDVVNLAATFKKGVLTVTLPKSAAAQAAEKKIAIKAD